MNDLDRGVAARVAESVLGEFKEMGFEELSGMLESSIRRTVQGDDGRDYNVVSYSLPDSENSLRVVVAVDDGRFFSSVRPLVRDFIIRDDGAIVS